MEVVKLKNCLKLNCQEMNQRDAAASGVNVMGIPLLVNQDKQLVLKGLKYLMVSLFHFPTLAP